MPIDLRQSTASQEVPLGYFVDSTDGDTEETGLTIANTDIKIWKNGATTLANKNSGGGTHISNGIYYAVLDATDSNTIGPMVIFVHVSGALAVRVECRVLAAAQYDFLYGTAAPMASYTQPTGFLAATFPSGTVANTTNITAGTITTTTNLTNLPTIPANWLTAAGIASGAFTSAKFAAGAFDAVWTVTTRELTAFSTSLALSVWNVLESAVVTASTMGLKVKNNLDAAITSRMASYTQPTGFLSATFPGGTIANTTNITAGTVTTATNVTNVNDKAGYSLTATTGLGNQTANITGNVSGSVGSVSSGVTVTTNNDKAGYSISGTKQTLDALNDVSAATVNAQADTAIADANLATAAAIAGLNNLSTSQVNAEVDAALADIHLDHLLATTYDPASKPGVADALLNELVENDGGVSRYTANALEQGPSGGGGSADWTADERTAIRSILGVPASGTTPDDPTVGILDTIRDGVAALPTASENADAVWDEDATGHQTQGTFGQAIGDPAADTNTIFKAVVTDATGATVGVDVVAVKADTTAILIDTAEIGAAGAGLTNINLPDQTMNITGNITGNLSGSVGSVTGLTAGNLDVAVSTRLATAGYTAPDNASIAAILTDTGTTLDAALAVVDANVDAIKAKTDSLAFTVAGQVDANVQYVNDVQVGGNGQTGTEWGPV